MIYWLNICEYICEKIMVTESILYKNKASEIGVYSVIFGKLW